MSETDICANNHKGNAESVAAFDHIAGALSSLRRSVLNAVFELRSATVKEIVDKTGMPRLTVGARLTELKQRGLLTPTDRRRAGCRVLVVTEAGRAALGANEWQ